ncbi:ABC transporter ATP-binding protein [Halopenitus persicus]|uniref:Amino acid/amide ABC transporter ATP-binding protein 2, HAAT family n=1 Tax=Halopenitus persicus TaxID=1048396 RepID=A0A1H3FXT5_9EURY|nr:ABC transporter ATP-binding protein [Halopenitus persicus]QHS16829.1 ABC transporter ATP-binding protein [haloarchaeon 3A1-DGR]SDX95893.1 amino acid/amide ABC transporter ATP-binding protein 2, HAAT family [Halopenitus persicus]
MSLLDVSDLEAGYETGQILFGVDFEIEEGEAVGLLGRNGAGKTTTMRAIMGADLPRIIGGSIRYRDTELLETASYDRADLGISFVPEERQLFPRLTVAENIHIAASSADDPLPAEEMFDLFPELDAMRDRHAKNMSGGEQQMLAIARALVSNPELMLLDEPCEGLAPQIVERLEDVVARINEERGVTVLIVEQNVATAMSIADRHYILDEGRLVEEVTTDRLREDDELRQTHLGV